MTVLDDLANATLRIECGSACGSGFQFLSDDIIVTNCHVIDSHLVNKSVITARTGDGRHSEAELLAFSPKDEYDFAILRAANTLGTGRMILEPLQADRLALGSEVAFAGFPHGIHDLLVHSAFISGFCKDLGFFLDGSVNAGNSGGPIIDAQTGRVIGITTQRRFIGAPEMQRMSEEAAELQTYLEKIRGSGQVFVMGVDFGEMARLMARNFSLLKEVIDANANAGIGIGFRIRFALEKCRELGFY